MKEQPIKGWVKASTDNLPEEKKQIVTKDELGNYGVHTLFGKTWQYQGEKYWERSENKIIEWLDTTPIQEKEERLFTQAQGKKIFEAGIESTGFPNKCINGFSDDKFCDCRFVCKMCGGFETYLELLTNGQNVQENKK